MDSKNWLEEYRPEKLSEVCGQEHIVTSLSNFAEQKYVPNLLFYGPPGTGKTTTAICFARLVLKEDYNQSTVMECNASDKRGIDFVRTEIKTFAQAKALTKNNSGLGGLKIVIMDEADSQTGPAQNAFRRVMEKECKNVRFIFTCNYLYKMIEPIQSRCSKYRFPPIPISDISHRLQGIAQKESIELDPEVSFFLAERSFGDMRTGILLLQRFNPNQKNKKNKKERKEIKIDIETLENGLHIIPKKKVGYLITTLCEKSSFSDAYLFVQDQLKKYNYDLLNLLEIIHEMILTGWQLPLHCNLCWVVDQLSELELSISMGCTGNILLSAFVAIFHTQSINLTE